MNSPYRYIAIQKAVKWQSAFNPLSPPVPPQLALPCMRLVTFQSILIYMQTKTWNDFPSKEHVLQLQFSNYLTLGPVLSESAVSVCWWIWLTNGYYNKSSFLGDTNGLPRWLSGSRISTNAGDEGSIPGSGRFPGEESSNPLQCSCLGSPMDRGPWWASPWGLKELDTTEQLHTIVTKNWTRRNMTSWYALKMSGCSCWIQTVPAAYIFPAPI